MIDFTDKEDEDLMFAYRQGMYFEDIVAWMKERGHQPRREKTYRERVDRLTKIATRQHYPVKENPAPKEVKTSRFTEREDHALKLMKGYAVRDAVDKMVALGFKRRDETVYRQRAAYLGFKFKNVKGLRGVARKSRVGYTIAEDRALAKYLNYASMTFGKITEEMEKRGFPPRGITSYSSRTRTQEFQRVIREHGPE